jgi:uncharacterized phage protein gp47/JayE
MPYARPTLTDLRTQVASDIQSGLPGIDSLLRFSNLNILGTALAGLGQLQYGYTDWVSLQANPFTATEEFLEAWAALKNVFRKPATQAGEAVPGQVTFPGTDGTPLPSGTALSRSDGVAFTTTSSGVVAGNSVTVNAVANADPTGLTGSFGNCVIGTIMTLGMAIGGIQSSGTVTTSFVGGADIETDDSLRSRMLQAYQNVPQGGAQQDYVTWALQVAGVTRAWCNPNGAGAGTVVVYPMLDITEAEDNGFPQGTDGVATLETRGIPTAAGDQLEVANWIYPLRPATALVYVTSPIPQTVNFAITGSTGFSSTTKSLIAAAISGIFVLYGSPLGSVTGQNGVVDMSFINSAIGAISGSSGFVVTVPTGNIVGTTGQLPILGTITWLP